MSSNSTSNSFSTAPKCRPPSLMHLLCPQDVPVSKRTRPKLSQPTKPGPPPPPMHPPALQQVRPHIYPIRVHGPSSPVTVNREKRSVDKKNLHLPRGERETPYRCPVCNKYYSRKDNLRAHARVHTGEKPFRCDICHRPFRWVGALRVHEKGHEAGMQNSRGDKF